jgi:WD40 repeat protein
MWLIACQASWLSAIETRTPEVVGQPSAAEEEHNVDFQSPDAGTQIATGSTVTIAFTSSCYYVTPTPGPATQLFTLEGQHCDRVWGVAWSPDGSMLASGSYDSTVIVWDADTGEQIRALVGHTTHVHGVAWSPDGTKLVSGAGWPYGAEDDPSDDRVIVWDVATGEPLHRLDRGQRYVIAVGGRPTGCGSPPAGLTKW